MAPTNSWRVSKYDPRQRTPAGYYALEEWTSAHDIGRAFLGKELTTAEYLQIEDAYVRTALAFHSDAGMPALLACAVESSDVAPNVPGDVLTVPPSEGSLILRSALARVVRSCLREIFWCRLEAEDGVFAIHFGHDFYMYVTGTGASAATRESAAKGRLYLEPFESPHRTRSGP